MQALVAGEYLALANLLEVVSAEVWDTPSLCEGWRTAGRGAHDDARALRRACLHGRARGRRWRLHKTLSNTVAVRDGELPASDLLDGLRAPSLHGWQPPGGGASAR